MPAVKCADCGFLSTRRSLSRETIEVEHETRTIGSIVGEVDKRLYCIVNSYQIDKECIKVYEKHPNDGRMAILEVIGNDRECAKFFRWVPGRSPKEHVDMFDNQLLRESLERREIEDKKWREEQDIKRREYEARQKEADKKWQQEQKQDEDKRRKEENIDDRKWQTEQEEGRREFQRRLSFTPAILATFSGILGVVIGAYIKKP